MVSSSVNIIVTAHSKQWPLLQYTSSTSSLIPATGRRQFTRKHPLPRMAISPKTFHYYRLLTNDFYFPLAGPPSPTAAAAAGHPPGERGGGGSRRRRRLPRAQALPVLRRRGGRGRRRRRPHHVPAAAEAGDHVPQRFGRPGRERRGRVQRVNRKKSGPVETTQYYLGFYLKRSRQVLELLELLLLGVGATSLSSYIAFYPTRKFLWGGIHPPPCT